ncbi:hypothetical protein ACTHQ4_02575 [Alkalicoccobacillus gibsonii]|uniref:hypothetical protein n=1 Tax=Alkalicoccobacillus gibsonii TaxID=79881 RepID=UPI003F7C99CD
MRTIIAWLTLLLIGTTIFVYLLTSVTDDITTSLLIGVLVHTSILLAIKVDKRQKG